MEVTRAPSQIWQINNSVLAAGQPGFETDTGKHKIGDGVHRWNELEYYIAESEVRKLIANATQHWDGGSP